VLHFLKNAQLYLPCKKFSPTYVGPFTIKSLLGDDTVYYKVTDQFRLVNPRVKIAYLRPYRLRTPDIGPPPARLSATPVSVEPDGSGWYQIEEILDHRGPPTNNGECLVRLKDFDTNHDTWIRCHSVTPLALCAYEEFLSVHVEYLQRIADCSRHKADMSRALASKKHLDSFIGRDGNFLVRRHLRTHRFPCRIPILSLQPLLQSLQYQRRLMLRKTLLCGD
jgi:hypothetical protein